MILNREIWASDPIETSWQRKKQKRPKVQHLKVLKNQTFMNMLTLPREHLDGETREFVKDWRGNEMAKQRKSMSAESPQVASPWAPRASRSIQPNCLGFV